MFDGMMFRMMISISDNVYITFYIIWTEYATEKKVSIKKRKLTFQRVNDSVKRISLYNQ